MEEKVGKISRNLRLICVCAIVLGIVNMIPILFGAPAISIAYMVTTGGIPLIIGVIFMTLLFRSQDLHKLYASAVHLCYLNFALGMSIILLAFAPAFYLTMQAAVFNIVASGGLIISGAWLLINSYRIARLSIIP